jgi:hypothetical protein
MIIYEKVFLLEISRNIFIKTFLSASKKLQIECMCTYESNFIWNVDKIAGLKSLNF